MAERKSTFSVELKGNAAPVAKETSAAIDQLAASIRKSEDDVKAMSAELRRLRGSSADVKTAKDKLKAAIAGARQEVTRDTLELRKLGATTADVTAKQKRLAEEEKKGAELAKKSSEARKKQGASLRAAVGAIGGPADSAASKLSSLTEVAEGLGTAEGAAALGAVGAVAGIAALGAGAVAGAYQLTKFIVASQSASREMNLLRTAAGGAEINGINMGTQVDALAKKVPILKGEINKTALELERFGLRGQTIVDTMNAVEQAAGVGDEALGAFAKDLVERGAQFNRFSLSPQELLGKNLRFDDVAAELAKSMHTGIDDARQALLTGQVELSQGAAALSSAMKRKFGGVNEALMLDPGHQVEKFEENLKELTSGVNIEPLLHDMHDFFDLFDSTKTTTGAAIKQLVSSLGGDLVDGIHSVAPAASDLVRNLVLGGLKVEGEWLEVKLTIKKAIEEATGGIDKLKLSLGGLVNPFASGQAIGNAVKGGHPGLKGGFLDSILGQAYGGADKANAAGANLANAASKGFTDAAEIHSPSRVFERHTENIVRGVTDPMRRGQSSVYDAMNVMLAPIVRGPQAGAESSSPAAAGGAREFNFNMRFEVTSERAAHALESPNFQAQFKKMMAEILIGAGMGVPK